MLVFGMLLLLWKPKQTEAEQAFKGKGVIDVTILFPYEVKQQSGDFLVSLFYESTELFHAVPLDTLQDQGMDITVEIADFYGNPVAEGEYFSTAAISFRKLPTGVYRFVLSGKGYKTYDAQIALENYSQHFIISNDNNTFTAGDFNQDGKVDQEDLALLKEKLGKFESSYDLNRDNMLDLIDYAYLYNNIKDTKKDDTIQKNTTLIADSMIDLAAVTDSLGSYGLKEEQVRQLLLQGEEASVVQLERADQAAISQEHPIELEIPFASKVAPELQYVVMTVPNDGTEPTNGEVVFEDDNGTTYSKSFHSVNELRLFARSSNQTIVVDLGRRIPVKRVTIKITGTAENTSLVSIAKVEFLQDIITTPQEERTQVKNVKAEAMDGRVSLSWDRLADAAEYIVAYGTVSGEYVSEYPSVGTSCVIDGLENDTEYYFVVYGKNGTWTGKPSKEVSCTPFAKEAPGRVGKVLVKAKNKALQISWQQEKTATSYKLFYKEKDAKEYEVISDIAEPKYYLANLTNGVEYLIMVSAVNAYGEGAKSPEALGTPMEVVIEEPEGLPTYQLIDRTHITNIRLSHPDHYDTTYYPNGVDPWDMVDGDYTTDWVARGKWWENQGFVVTFDQAYEMDHVVWVTRLDEEKFMSTINRYYIEVWGENDDLTAAGTVLVPYGTYLTRNPLSAKGVEILTFPKYRVKQIKVSTKMKDGGPASHSASELRFHEYYSLVDEIEALFKDDLHTTLAEGVTEQKIATYQERISGSTGEFYVNKDVLARELEIAKSLLPGNTPKKNVIEAEVGRNAGKDTDRNFAFTLNDLQPLGVCAKEKEEIIVYAEPDTAGELPSIVITQFAGEAASWSQTISLQRGRNIITIPALTSQASERGGALYLKYYGNGGAKINLFGGTKIPMLNLSEFSFESLTFTGTNFKDSKESQNRAAVQRYLEELEVYSKTLNQTQEKLEKAVLNSTEIATKHVLLSLPAKAVWNALSSYTTLEEKVDALYETLAAWEKNMQIHYAVCGLSADAEDTKDQYPSARINIRYMTITGKAFMYAGGAHIGIGYSSTAGMVNAPLSKSQNGLFGWGINHEIGHVLDQKGISKPETTNNLHSLFSQTFDGEKNLGTSRLEGDIYKSVLTKTAYSAPGSSNNVFVQLAMYWQLHLAYDGVGEESYNFYAKLYQLLRSNTVTADNADMLFVKLACDTAQKNLSEFFTHWGYVLTEDTINYISKYEPEQRPIYYGTDRTKRYMENGGSSVLEEKSLAVTANQDSKSVGQGVVELTISLPADVDSSKVLGYEIRRNNTVIAWVEPSASELDTIYLDENIAINNAVLEYEVIAYDLSYGVAAGTAEPFKLSYEGIFDNSEFSFILNDSTVTLESDCVHDIAGIRIYTGTDSKLVIAEETKTSSGSALGAKVKIGENEIDAFLTPAFEKDGFTTYYFTSSSDPQDGSLQTYTTNRISVTFSQVGYSTEELKDQFFAVSYPGDTIEFYNPKEQAFFGVLGQDYVYDGGKIDKGSIILLGIYRGNPVYNVILLKGIYSSTSEEGDDNAENVLEEKVLEGEQLLFAVLPENKVVTEISNGIWIYLPELKEDEKLPDMIYAELYRVDDPNTLEGQRLVSNTLSLPVPSLETLPVIYLNNRLSEN